MAQDLNTITLVGRTTADVELKTTTSGKSVASFTLANNGYNDATNFINVVAWNKTAELLAQYAPKGKQLAITGRLTTRSYEDKQGNKRTATEVVVNDFQLLGGGEKSEQRDYAPTDISDEAVDLSSIPF